MKPELAEALRAADDPDHWEMPPSFPWREEIDRIQELKPQLERAVGKELVLDDNVQDSAAFAELRAEVPPDDRNVVATIIGVRFSAFGRFVSIWSSVGREFAPLQLEPVVRELRSAGYVYVPAEALAAPYNGRHVLRDRIDTWWERFFGYP